MNGCTHKKAISSLFITWNLEQNISWCCRNCLYTCTLSHFPQSMCSCLRKSEHQHSLLTLKPGGHLPPAPLLKMLSQNWQKWLAWRGHVMPLLPKIETAEYSHATNRRGQLWACHHKPSQQSMSEPFVQLNYPPRLQCCCHAIRPGEKSSDDLHLASIVPWLVLSSLLGVLGLAMLQSIDFWQRFGHFCSLFFIFFYTLPIVSSP